MRDTKDGPKQITSCKTVKVVQPKKNVIANIRAFTWLSYSLKELAKGFNDIETFKAEATFSTKRIYTYGLTFEQQKKVGDQIDRKQSLCLGTDILAEQVRVFRNNTSDKMPEWLVEGDDEATANNQACILTKMVLNRLGKTRFVLARTFFAGSRNGANIYRKLVLMKPADDSTSPRYATALYNAIKSHLVVILDTVTSNDDMFKQLNKLKCFKNTFPTKSALSSLIAKPTPVSYGLLKASLSVPGIKCPFSKHKIR